MSARTKKILSAAEVATLLKARRILMALADRAEDSQYHTDTVSPVDQGRLAGTASLAEWGMFSVMNVANSYCHVPIEKFRPEGLH